MPKTVVVFMGSNLSRCTEGLQCDFLSYGFGEKYEVLLNEGCWEVPEQTSGGAVTGRAIGMSHLKELHLSFSSSLVAHKTMKRGRVFCSLEDSWNSAMRGQSLNEEEGKIWLRLDGKGPAGLKFCGILGGHWRCNEKANPTKDNLWPARTELRSGPWD